MDKNKSKQGIRLWSKAIYRDTACIVFSPRDHWTALGFENGEVQLLDGTGKQTWSKVMKAPVVDLGISEFTKTFTLLTSGGELVSHNFSGSPAFDKNMTVTNQGIQIGSRWTNFETLKDGFLLWSWNSIVLQLNTLGKKVRVIGLPTPLKEVKFIPKSSQFFVIHDTITVAVYDSIGTHLWETTHPSPIETSGRFACDVSASDSGNMVAIGGYEKGVFLYNLLDRTLKNIELEKPVARVSVSRDGKFLLLADVDGEIFLVSRDVEILWRGRLDSEIVACRLDHNGHRALVMDKSGNLACFEFTEDDVERTKFLELQHLEETQEKRALWKKPRFKSDQACGEMLQVSHDGNAFLYGTFKDFYVFDSQGNPKFMKGFLTLMDGGNLSDDGKFAFIHNPEEVFIVDVENSQENHLTFYKSVLRELAFDPGGNGFLTYDKGSNLSLYSRKGELRWKRFLKSRITNIQLQFENQQAVFQDDKGTFYFLNFKDFSLKKIALEEPVIKVKPFGTGFLLGGAQGGCFLLDENGSIVWKEHLKTRIINIWPLQDKMGFQLSGGNLFLYDSKGTPLGQAKLQKSRSILCDSFEGIMEVVPDGTALKCFDVLSENLAWKIDFPGKIQEVDVSRSGNRIIVLDDSYFYCHSVVDATDPLDERTSFLEF